EDGRRPCARTPRAAASIRHACISLCDRRKHLPRARPLQGRRPGRPAPLEWPKMAHPPAAAAPLPFPHDRGRLACNRPRRCTSAPSRRLEGDGQHSPHAQLTPRELPGFPGIDIYFKDESSHPTGSLKHRLARSLFLYALANGWLHEGSTVVEASSGSTAVSEAYFARLLGLPFVAVIPASTSPEKIA